MQHFTSGRSSSGIIIKHQVAGMLSPTADKQVQKHRTCESSTTWLLPALDLVRASLSNACLSKSPTQMWLLASISADMQIC